MQLLSQKAILVDKKFTSSLLFNVSYFEAEYVNVKFVYQEPKSSFVLKHIGKYLQQDLVPMSSDIYIFNPQNQRKSDKHNISGC